MDLQRFVPVRPLLQETFYGEQELRFESEADTKQFPGAFLASFFLHQRKEGGALAA